MAGAILPFAIITPAAVGAVALADSYLPLRLGIPHAIGADMYLGFGEGIALMSVRGTCCALQRVRSHCEGARS